MIAVLGGRGDSCARYEDATRHMALTAGGKAVSLAIEGRDDRDRYGRLLAFVDVVEGPDAGPNAVLCAAPPPPAPAPGPAAEPALVAPAPAPAGVVHADCDAVGTAGAAPIRPLDPGWQSKFDRDKDGVGCDT